MANLFSGLESLGFSDLSKLEVYEDGGKKKAGGKEEAKAVHQLTEEDYLFDKTYTCPVCDKEFKAKNVRTGKAKLISADSDLRPKYQGVDSLKYDAIVCPVCGYAALNRFFNYMTSPQAKLIKEQISRNFRGIKDEGAVYSYDEAITRHKLALVNAVVKRGKLSERAYTCLKTAWLLRGKAENLPAETENLEKVKAELEKEEQEFLTNAYEGFLEAASKENYPMCGMDEDTVMYLVADLARRIGRYDEASRWISRVLTSRTANERIKTKAREIKEMLREK